MPFLSGVITPQDYGATGNGTTDDTAACQAAINAGNAAGVPVFFPPGTYLCTPSGSPAVALSQMGASAGYQGVTIYGASNQTATLKKNGPGTLLQLSGPSSSPSTGSTHCRYASVSSLGFNGNGYSGPLIQAYYADNIFLEYLYLNNNADIVMDTAEFWDSRIYNCVFGGSGGAANASMPNLYLRNSAAASGFGNSTGTTNDVVVDSCRFEAFLNGGVWIGEGPGNSAGPNSIFLVNSKLETSVVNGGSHLLVDATTRAAYAENLYCYSGGFNTGFSTAQTVISWSGQDSTIANVLISDGSSATVANGLSINSTVAGQNAVARNVTGTYTTAPTGAHVAFGTATGGWDVQNCNANAGTAFTGIPNAAVSFPLEVAFTNTSNVFTTAGAMAAQPAASGNTILSANVGGTQSFDNFRVTGAGALTMGPGTATRDTSFGRSATGVGYVTNSLLVGASTDLGDNGSGELKLANAGTVPSTNPTGGALVYATGGQVTIRNPQGLVQSVNGVINVVTSTVTIASTAALTNLYSFAMPANDPIAGAIYVIEGYGVFSTTGTPTILFQLYWGGTELANIPAITTASGLSNASFTFKGTLNFRSATTCFNKLELWLGTSGSTDAASTYLNAVSSIDTVTTNTSQNLTVAAQWGAAATGNTISLLGGMIERLN